MRVFCCFFSIVDDKRMYNENDNLIIHKYDFVRSFIVFGCGVMFQIQFQLKTDR